MPHLVIIAGANGSGKSTSAPNELYIQQYKNDCRTWLECATPKQVKYLDLSDNGFEQDEGEELRALLINLPKTVKYVSFAHEKPVSPAKQIAKRTWPTSFQRLTADAPDIMQQARRLLTDYTKDDSPFKRFITFHWNRHHTEVIAKLVRYIDSGLISIDDLLAELERINLLKESDTLGKQLAFLLKASFEHRGHQPAAIAAPP